MKASRWVAKGRDSNRNLGEISAAIRKGAGVPVLTGVWGREGESHSSRPRTDAARTELVGGSCCLAGRGGWGLVDQPP